VVSSMIGAPDRGRHGRSSGRGSLDGGRDEGRPRSGGRDGGGRERADRAQRGGRGVGADRGESRDRGGRAYTPSPRASVPADPIFSAPYQPSAPPAERSAGDAPALVSRGPKRQVAALLGGLPKLK